jgi:hypothetical protein
MKELRATLERLLTQAEDCVFIGRLAADAQKRELFKSMAVGLRKMKDIEAMNTDSSAPGRHTPCTMPAPSFRPRWQAAGRNSSAGPN